MPKFRSSGARLTLLATLSICSAPVAAAADLSYGGRVVDEQGAPVAGPVDITIRFFGSATGNDQLGSSLSFPAVALRDGVFQLTLSLDDREQGLVFGDASRTVYAEVEAGGKVYPRQSFAAVPMALRVPIDNDTLVFAPDSSRLTIDHVRMSQVTGLTEALAAKRADTAASSGTSGYLSAADWTRFDAKQAPIDATTTVDAGGLTTAQQGGVLLKPFGSNANETGELRFEERSGGHYVGFRAPDAIAADRIWTLPDADGSTGQFLSTNGSGVLSWTSPAGGGDVLASANLSDLADPAAARGNLGLGSLATASSVSAAQITDGTITNADISGTAAIATSKLSGALTSISGHGLGALATLGAVGSAQITDGSVASTDIADGTVTNADVSDSAAIATSKLSGAVTSIAGHGLGALATLSAVGSGEISDGTIADADVSGSAAIATSKLSGAVTSIAGHGLGALATSSAVGSGEITDGAIADADVSGTAAIATSKLSGAVTSISGHGLGALASLGSVGSNEITNGSIVDADISGTAAISSSKISFAADSISGNTIDGGTISNFASTGIDDNASSTAVTIGSAGNVGIGTTNPSQQLQLTGNLLMPASAGNSAGNIFFAGDTSTGATGMRLSSDTSSGGISYLDVVSATLGLRFRVDSTNGATPRMTILPNGNIGIGTTTPEARLAVTGSAGVSSITAAHFGGTKWRMQHDLGDEGNAGVFDYRGFDSRALSLVGAGVSAGGATRTVRIWDRMTVGYDAPDPTTSLGQFSAAFSGKVGIGTTEPAGLLDVNGKLTVLSGGNVGIGTTAPAGKFHVAVASSQTVYGNVVPGLVFQNTDTGTSSINSIAFSNAATAYSGGYYGALLSYIPTGGATSNVGGALTFATKATAGGTWFEAMRLIDGNVGIGTTSPSAKLQVSGQAASTSVSGSSLAIDFNGGNIQSTSAAAGTLVLSNMIDGASYTLVLTNATGGSYVLSGSSVSTWHCSPTCNADTITVVAGKHTVLSAFKIGTDGYVSWINNL